MYKCPRCHHETNKKSTILSHYLRKNPCEAKYSDISLKELHDDLIQDHPSKTIECQHCDKKFSSRSGLFYHQKQCTREAALERKLNEIIDLLASRPPQQVTINNIENQTINNNQQIAHEINNQPVQHIHAFGKENTDYITSDFAMQCFLDGSLGLKLLLSKIYFNKEHAENHNARLASLKHMLVEMFKDPDGWVSESFTKALDMMISRSRDVMMRHVTPMILDKLDEDHIVHAMGGVQDIKPEYKKQFRDMMLASLVDRRKKTKEENA